MAALKNVTFLVLRLFKRRVLKFCVENFITFCVNIAFCRDSRHGHNFYRILYTFLWHSKNRRRPPKSASALNNNAVTYSKHMNINSRVIDYEGGFILI